MEIRNLIIVLFTTFAAFSTLYAMQPLLPLLVGELGISPDDAALLMTATLRHLR